MPPKRNMNINDVYERIMARMKERLDQFVDQFDNRMNDMMNLRRYYCVAGDNYEGSPVFDDDYEEASVFNDDQFEKNRCRFMIPILKMSLWRKNDLLGKEDLVRKKKTWKTLLLSLLFFTMSIRVFLFSLHHLLNIDEYFGKVILPEDCTHRQFNMSHGKVCILSDRIEFIKETIHIPFGKEIISVRVEEYKGDTDSLFNGYVFDSISEDDESLRTEPVTGNHSDSFDEDYNLDGEDPKSVEESVTGDESDTQDGFSKNHQVGDSSEHGRDSEKVENTHSWNVSTTFLVEQVNDKSPLCCKVPDNVNVHIPIGFLSTDNHQTLQCQLEATKHSHPGNLYSG
ncbi:hypothetical protein Tco_1367217 [Tanacetum coccineum]